MSDTRISLTGWTRERLQLEMLITAANKARAAADNNALFESRAGMSLVNAIYDLIEIDAVYDLAGDIGQSIGLDQEGQPILYLADRQAREVRP